MARKAVRKPAAKPVRKLRVAFIGAGGIAGTHMRYLKEMADVCLVIPVDEEPLGTPLAASYHVALHHLICTALRLRIWEDGDE